MIGTLKSKSTSSGLEARIAGITARRLQIANAVVPKTQRAEVATRDAADIGLASPASTAAQLATNSTSCARHESSEERFELHLAGARDELIQRLSAEIGAERRAVLHRRDIAKIVDDSVRTHLAGQGIALNTAVQRGFVTEIMQELSDSPEASAVVSGRSLTEVVETARTQIYPLVLEHMNVKSAAAMPRAEFQMKLSGWIPQLLADTKIQLNLIEQRTLVELLVADMLGVGPLEPLIKDETISDIMVNGPNQVYVEWHGKIELTDVKFRDDQHLMHICTKIVTWIGRRIDESRPLVDARLPDGSRVNIIIPPLAVDGVSVSIRKFSKKTITLDTMAISGSISPAMATLLKIAARCRLNILISGGTGSGKTTLLNALSRMIDGAERTVTIEDAVELQLQQPHVVRLETRTANLEGGGEVTIRDLLRNALRMRPDRIVIGECRGEEALDMLQALNTGHDGSMSTIHANNPRDALARLETMIGMAGIALPPKAVRTQIASAIDLICQVSRMRDGVRRVTQITEVVGMEGDIVTTQDLFTYEFQGLGANGKLQGSFRSGGIRPLFLPRAEYFGLSQVLLEVI